VLVALTAAIPVILAATGLALTHPAHSRFWRRVVAELRLAGPALGLLVAAMNSFHMAHTIMRSPFDPGARQLAPGVFEVSALAGLGALVGLVAVAANFILSWSAARPRTPETA
jgi:hypothetical protein